MRDAENIDNFVRAGYERLYNVQQGDIWGSYILDYIAPVTARGTINDHMGFSYHEDIKFKNKSKFLTDFYQGGKRPQY